MPTVPITHFSDVLCIWAYINQIRTRELQVNFPDEVEFHFRYFNVFGDVHSKMETNWGERGGLEAYAEHVQGVVAGFSHVTLNKNVWRKNIPVSSMPAHLLIAAARLWDKEQNSNVAPLLDVAIREAFFGAAVDVSNFQELFAIAAEQALDIGDIKDKLNSGRAHALVAQDLKVAADLGIKSSPTLTFNAGRQTLSGNVSYRILEANIRELTRYTDDQQSWC
jgi:predicted DsbA family dithiol-disulfide isomerase